MRLHVEAMIVWALFAVMIFWAFTSTGPEAVVSAAGAGAVFPLAVAMLVWLIQEDRK